MDINTTGMQAALPALPAEERRVYVLLQSIINL